MSALARLTHTSTQTLTLLLERQRLEALNQPVPPSTTSQITRNLAQLRAGVLDMEQSAGPGEATRVLREQYERMRAMLGPDGESIESLKPLAPPSPPPKTEEAAPPPSPPQLKLPTRVYEPYRDDDDEPEPDVGEVLGQQRQVMADQDTQLEQLGHSIRRQRDISIQIGDELDVHTGLLEQLDADVDDTERRMSGAQRRLGQVAEGAKRNGSTIAIAGLIFVLLVLIIVFKT